jgi:RHS repeat-associated protein
LRARSPTAGPETTTGNLGYVSSETRNSSNTLLAKSLHYFHGSPKASFSQKPTHYDAWRDGNEYKTEVFDTNGSTILNRIEHSFAQRASVNWWGGSSDTAPPNDPRTTETITTIEPGGANLVSKQTFGFDDSVPFNNQNNVKEYAFGTGSAGALMRETRTTFITSTSYTDAAVHLRSLRSQISTYDGSSVEKARVTYEYDNYTLVANHAYLTPRSDISGFDSAFDTSYATRGNATATTRHFLVGGSVIGSVSTYSQYDIAGNVVKAIDARGNAVDLFYTDCFGAPNGDAQTPANPTELGSATKTFAFATEVKNVLNQSAFAQFDYYLGQPVDAKDVNGFVASGYFNDNLDRVTEIKRAVGSALENRTVFNYDDASRVVTTTRDQEKVGGVVTSTLVSDVRYDLMGRTIETRQYEGGGNFISTQTQYDTLGRAHKTSNPFRPWQSETAVWTTQVFDALDRVVSVTTPDSAVMTTTYSGNSSTVSDQTGKQRKTVTDALGRLIEVYEAPNDVSLNYLTSYTYDTLDNLTTVTQGSQTRTYTYDSLKRMVSATNPESGNVSYQYDNNGNVLVKTDARGVSTHSEYDLINRVTRRWYNGSSSVASTTHNTPALPAGVGTTDEVKFFYDGQTLPSGAPTYSRSSTTGRLVAQTYGAGSNGDYFAYDGLGRPTLKIQQTGAVEYQISAAYNVANALTSLTYPSGRTVSQSYDAAGRVTGLTGYLGDGSNRTYSNEIIYSPFGSLAKEKLGTTTPVYNKLFYNVRGQLAEIRESTSYSGPTDYDANRGAIINNYSNLCAGICSGSSMTDNNGTLKKQEIVIPGQTSRIQEYSYDNLNRLLSTHELVANVEQWKQQFTYDRWGNRTINIGATYGTGINNKAFTVDAGTNRLGVPGGQSGVMQYDAGGNLTNDTYTGAGNRTYDGNNKITSAWGGNNQAQLYGYDGKGLRIKRAVDGVETWHVYGFGGELIAEYASSGAAALPRKEYGYRNGQLLITADAASTAMQNANWTNAVGVSVSGNTLTRTMAGDGWSTGAISSQIIAVGDGYAEFTATETNKQRAFGLTSNTSVTSYQYISYGFVLGSDGAVVINENIGVYGTFGTYATGDKFRVSIEGGVVKFRKNGTLLRTSSTAPTYPLYAGASISSNAGTITNAVITSNLHSAVWTNAVGVSISNNNLTRTMAGDGWSTGARSSQSIAAGDGYAEFTATETNKQRAFGLTTNTSVTSYQYISYGIVLGTDGAVVINEGVGVYGTFGTYTTGDKFRVSIEGGVVKFRKNGTLLRTSSTAPTYPLYAGASISSNVGTITNALLTSGTLTSTTAQFRWLVADHLGTPRMIFDESGDVANTKRHDYLPFGEELFAPVAGRTPGMGYSGGDGIRQQFTSKERDIETGLDYFSARYHSSTQGRFTSADSVAGSYLNPQSLNLYSYVANNPLRFIDPTGHRPVDMDRWDQIPPGCMLCQEKGGQRPTVEAPRPRPNIDLPEGVERQRDGTLTRKGGAPLVKGTPGVGAKTKVRAFPRGSTIFHVILFILENPTPVGGEDADLGPNQVGWAMDKQDTFKDHTFDPQKLDQDMLYYRVYSEEVSMQGRFLTAEFFESSAEAVKRLALSPDVTPNKATHIVSVFVPAGTVIARGLTAPQNPKEKYPGGASQIMIENPNGPGIVWGTPQRLRP